MSLLLAIVVTLCVCLTVVIVLGIVWYNNRRKNEELEQGSDDGLELEEVREEGLEESLEEGIDKLSNDGPGWEYWLTPKRLQLDHVTTKTDLICQPTAALRQSTMSDKIRPIPLKQLPLRLHVIVFTLYGDHWAELMEIDDTMNAVIPEKPYVVYSFYFNPVLMVVNPGGKLEDPAKSQPVPIHRFCAVESGVIIEEDIDGIIYEPVLADSQALIVDRIARPKEFVLGISHMRDALIRLTDQILQRRESGN